MKWWDEGETLKAAESASSLSELLEQNEFYDQKALRWLEGQHIDKFLNAIDATESEKLKQFAFTWSYTDSESKTRGFPLLDWLWVIGPVYDWQRRHINLSDEPGAGRKLVARLAEFQLDWISRWWKWRCAEGKRFILDLTSVENAVIKALTQNEFESHLSEITDDIAIAIIERKPEFIDVLPGERCKVVLRHALEEEHKVVSIVETLSEQGIPSEAMAVIDNVFGSSKQSGVINQLDELVTRWQSPPGSDPVAIAMTQGHEDLSTLFRSRWSVPNQSLGSDSDKKLWEYPLEWGNVGRAFASAVRAAPDRFRLELGFSIGLRIAERAEEPSSEKISEHLKQVGIDPSNGMVDILLPMVKLWATLRTLAKYQANYWEHKTELVGLRARIASLAQAAPDLWAQSLPWILIRDSKLGDVAQAVTLELATTNPKVRSALENACNDDAETIKLKASGLWVLLNGLEDPRSDLPRTLADAAAHYMDGIPIFPHPLEPMSATWLGSIGVEQALANGVRRAASRFATEVRDQGGDIEEALTKALVKEIEVEFREIQPQLKLFGSSHSTSLPPILSVCQRPTSKSIEEPVYGCDLAWLLNATVRGRLSATWVEIVQVKKSTALYRHGNAMPRADSWRIESKQLNDILKWSATAAYWLIASGGEVLTIPAKHLAAIRQETKGDVHTKTFTVGYHEVRSVAISLEQYLVDLLIGQWVGTCSEDIVQFAQGDNPNIRPRMIIEVTISIGHEKQ